jgi:hypothetical protein
VARVQLQWGSLNPMAAQKRRDEGPSSGQPLLEGIDASLLDIVDHVLTKGIVITGDLVLGVADIDLIYLRLSAVLCAADRVLPNARGRRHGLAKKRFSKSIASKMLPISGKK